jgi:hypothetical protein
MTKYTTAGVIVEWESGTATGFASRQEAERFIEHICRKTAPNLDYSIYSINRINGSNY